MSWQQLPTEVREAAQAVLTPKQLDVFKLTLAGCSPYRISVMLSVSRRTVRDHIHASHIRLEQAGVRRDASGRYYQQEAA